MYLFFGLSARIEDAFERGLFLLWIGICPSVLVVCVWFFVSFYLFFPIPIFYKFYLL